MARTINGNLTGRAAQTELSDLRERMYQAEKEARAQRKQARCIDIGNSIRDLLGTQEAYNAWW